MTEPINDQIQFISGLDSDVEIMNMFISLNTVMSAATPAKISYIVDSGAGMSGVTSTSNLMASTACKVPITPAFGIVLCATSEGLIRDDILGYLRVRALHVKGMHQNFLSVNQVCNGGTTGQRTATSIKILFA